MYQILFHESNTKRVIIKPAEHLNATEFVEHDLVKDIRTSTFHGSWATATKIHTFLDNGYRRTK